MTVRTASVEAKLAALEIAALLQPTAAVTLDPQLLRDIATTIDDAITTANDCQIGVLREVMRLLGPLEVVEGLPKAVREAVGVSRDAGVR